jgi:hypothetical protein
MAVRAVVAANESQAFGPTLTNYELRITNYENRKLFNIHKQQTQTTSTNNKHKQQTQTTNTNNKHKQHTQTTYTNNIHKQQLRQQQLTIDN